MLFSIISDRTQILLPSYRILAEILIDVLAQFPGERALEKRNKRYIWENITNIKVKKGEKIHGIIDDKILPARLRSMKQKQQIINYVHEKYRASNWLKTTAFSCNTSAN